MYKISRQFGANFAELAVACNNCNLPGDYLDDENSDNLDLTDDVAVNKIVNTCIEEILHGDHVSRASAKAVLKMHSVHPVPVCTCRSFLYVGYVVIQCHLLFCVSSFRMGLLHSGHCFLLTSTLCLMWITQLLKVTVKISLMHWKNTFKKLALVNKAR